MTQTRHAFHIAGTPTDDEQGFVPVACGGPTLCSICDFDVRWHKDYVQAKQNRKSTYSIFPSEIDGLDSQLLRKLSANLRERTPEPSPRMLVRRYQLAASIYTLADAMDSLAKDLELE